MKWKKEYIQKLIKRYKYTAVIAKQLGLSRQRVYDIVKYYGLHCEKGYNRSNAVKNALKERLKKIKARNKEIVEFYKKGYSREKLAKKYHVGPKVIYRCIRHILKKENDESIKDRDKTIIFLYSHGKKQIDIAKYMDLTQCTVCTILNKNGIRKKLTRK